jgi:predicted transcriptional regulator
MTTPLTVGVKQSSSLFNQHHHHARLSPLYSTTTVINTNDAIGSANLDWPNLG